MPDIRVLNIKASEYTITYSVHSLDFDPDQLDNPDYYGIDNEPAKTLGPFIEGSLKNYGCYKVYYQVSTGDKTKDGFVYIKIRQAESYVAFSDLSIDYNGQPRTLGVNEIRGSYNSNDASNLKVYFYDAEDYNYCIENSEIPTPISAPINVGNYVVEIINLADDDPTVIKNYTRVKSVTTFEIRKATVNLRIDLDYEINSDKYLSQYDINVSEKTFANSTNVIAYFGAAQTASSHTAALTGTLSVTGLKGSDQQVVAININKALLEKKVYQIQLDKLSIDKTVEQEIDSSPNPDYYWSVIEKELASNTDFIKLYWDETIVDNANTISHKLNYQINVDFKLNVHYRTMDYTIYEREVDYDASSHQVYWTPNDAPTYQADSAIVFNVPSDYDNIVVKFGTTPETCTANNKYFSAPGSYRVFFEATYETEDLKYEKASGSFVFKINYIK